MIFQPIFVKNIQNDITTPREHNCNALLNQQHHSVYHTLLEVVAVVYCAEFHWTRCNCALSIYNEVLFVTGLVVSGDGYVHLIPRSSRTPWRVQLVPRSLFRSDSVELWMNGKCINNAATREILEGIFTLLKAFLNGSLSRQNKRTMATV